MRRTIMTGLALAAVLSSATALVAQTQERPAEPPGRNPLRALFRDVNLTAEQEERIKAIHESYVQQTTPIREELHAEFEKVRSERRSGGAAKSQDFRAALECTKPQREQLRALLEHEHQEVRSVLTPEQQKRFDQNVAELESRRGKRVATWRDRRGERDEERCGEPRGSRF